MIIQLRENSSLYQAEYTKVEKWLTSAQHEDARIECIVSIIKIDGM